MKYATLTAVDGLIIIRTPYHPALIAEIKRFPGRKYNGELRLWSVPAHFEEQLRATIRKYLPIEDEANIAMEGLPEVLPGMLAVLRLEFIGENYYTYKKQATISHEGTERFKGYLGRNQSRPWVKRLTALDGRITRDYVNGQIDYSQANSTGSRGVFLYYYLEPGVYEINERTSWTHVRRYFIRVVETRVAEISREEVEQCLQSKVLE